MKQPTAVKAWRHYNETFEHDDVINYEYNKYINFLTQAPKLWMFVPCKKEIKGNWRVQTPEYEYTPLEKPEQCRDKFFVSSDTSAESQIYHQGWHERREEYQQAIDRVVYDGWEIQSTKGHCTIIEHDWFGILEFWTEESVFGNIVKFNGNQVKTRQDMVGFEMRENWYKKYFNN